MMVAHVNKLGSLCHCLECCLNDILWFTHESHHCTVGSFTRVNIEQFNTFYTLNLVSNLFDYFQVASFTEVRYALNNLLRLSHVFLIAKFIVFI